MNLFVLELFLLDFAKIFVQAIEAFGPETPVMLDPVGYIFEGASLEAARTPLRFAAAGDQPGALEHFEVLGDGGHADVKGLCELRDGSFSGDKASQDGAAGGIGESGKGVAESIGGHGVFNL